jgi:hypothetical protein
VACLRTSREMSLICGGREGSRSAAGSTGREARDAKTLESEDDFPAVSRPARGLERVRTSTSSYVHLPKSLISATSAMVIAVHVCCAWVRGQRDRRSVREERSAMENAKPALRKNKK